MQLQRELKNENTNENHPDDIPSRTSWTSVHSDRQRTELDSNRMQFRVRWQAEVDSTEPKPSGSACNQPPITTSCVSAACGNGPQPKISQQFRIVTVTNHPQSGGQGSSGRDTVGRHPAQKYTFREMLVTAQSCVTNYSFAGGWLHSYQTCTMTHRWAAVPW